MVRQLAALQLLWRWRGSVPISIIEVTILKPEAKTYTSKNIDVQITASTSANSITSIKTYLDGELKNTCPSNPCFSQSFVLAVATEGNHLLRAVATDSNSYQAEATVQFLIDSVLPVINSTTPAQGSYIWGTNQENICSSIH